MNELHKRGLKTTLNVHPADGIRAFEDAYPAVSETTFSQYYNLKNLRYLTCQMRVLERYFEEVHHPLEKQGVDFWWIDWQQGTEGQIDPLWLLNYYHFKDITREEITVSFYLDMQVLEVIDFPLVFQEIQ